MTAIDLKAILQQELDLLDELRKLGEKMTTICDAAQQKTPPDA